MCSTPPSEDLSLFTPCSYNAATYENDIALVKLEPLPFTDKCLEDNPAVSAVCVPWSTQLFQANHTCSISGWGRTAGKQQMKPAGGESVGGSLWEGNLSVEDLRV